MSALWGPQGAASAGSAHVWWDVVRDRAKLCACQRALSKIRPAFARRVARGRPIGSVENALEADLANSSRDERFPAPVSYPPSRQWPHRNHNRFVALEEHRGDQTVVSIGLNALMLYPDRPFALGTLYGRGEPRNR